VAHELEQVFEKLAYFSGSDVVLEIEAADAFAEEDVEVVVVEDFEGTVVALQDVEAVVVERVGLGVFGRGAGELDALLHFSGGVLGVGEGEDFFGLGVALLD